jgi:SAM-dependent methyltransferase
MDMRSERERRFFDQQELGREGLDSVYAITATSREFFEGLIRAHCPNVKVLELGCGWGLSSIRFAGWGADVIGIDVSTKRIEWATEKAAEQPKGSARFLVMDAERLEFDDDTFDVVCGQAVLHHLELHRACSEIVRVLKPEGVAIFVEPLGHNPFINLFRRLTPNLRTPDERPLRMADVGIARKFFGRVDLRFFYLAALAAVPFRRFGFFPALIRRLNSLDRGVFATAPRLRRYAWQIGIVLRDPRKAAAADASAGHMGRE